MSKKSFIFSVIATTSIVAGATAIYASSGVTSEPVKLAQACGQGYGCGQGQGYGWGRSGGQGYGQGRRNGYGMGRGHGAGHRGNRVRHRIVRHQGLPEKYAKLTNTVPVTPAVIKQGKALYGENCASCHGAGGAGDGEAGKDLNPKPANIAFIMDKWIATDGFLFWSITEGGENLKTQMPAFKESLSEKQRWSIIHYLRKGL